MTFAEMRLVAPEELQGRLVESYYDLQALVDAYREPERPKNRKLLDELMQKIAGGVAIIDWGSGLAGGLLTSACALGRDAIIEAEAKSKLPAKLALSISARADWLCAIYCAAPELLNEHQRTTVAAHWVMSRLLAIEVIEDAEGIVGQLASALAPMGLSDDIAKDLVRVQIVQRAVRSRELPRPFGMDEKCTLQWCERLLSHPQFGTLLTGAARGLGLDVPVREQQPRKVDTPAVSRQPQIWPVGDLAYDGPIEQEFIKVLFALQTEAKMQGSAFQQATGGEVNALNPKADPPTYGPVIFQCLNDLWVRYWTHGDSRVIDLMMRVAKFLWQLLDQRKSREDLRSDALHFWMNTQLPVLIRTADLAGLIADADLLARRLECRVNARHMRRSIVEAHAGECQRLKSAGNTDELEGLKRDNGEALRALAKEYQGEVGRGPNGKRDLAEFQAAWELVFPESVDGAARTDEGRSRTSFLTDQGFSDVIRRGAVEGVKEWIDAQVEPIQETLQRRLNVHLNPDHLMRPYGRVFQSGTARRDQPDPMFLEAKEALKKADFRAAASLFGRLAERSQARSRDIARNHQAFALARQGELLQARQYLTELCRAGYTDSAAHWNLACCIPTEGGEARQQQLQVLREGLRFTPHPQILDGAVFLALWLQDDDFLREWLPQLTLFEALLLSYRLAYDNLDFAKRDLAIQRLGQYVRDGEPDRPDPTDDYVSMASVRDYQDTLIDRHQASAFEFWLACRKLVAEHRWEFWQFRTDFLDRTQRREEAAGAFLNELNCRLGLLRKLADRRPPYNFIPDTRKRTEQWLMNCMTRDNLRPIGADIFETLSRFIASAGPVGAELLTRDRRILGHYAAARERNSSVIQEQNKSSQSTPPDLSTVLLKAAGVCFSTLHEVSQLPRVNTELTGLTRALRANGKTASALALDSLLKDWSTQGATADRAERLATLKRAQNTLGDLRGSLLRELSTDQNREAAPLLAALGRVSDRLARTLELVPELRIEPIAEASPQVDPEAPDSSFSVRISGASADAPVRITGATATLHDGNTDLRLRNDLQGLAVIVDGSRQAVLSFSISSAMMNSVPQTATIVVKFEVSGASFNTSPEKILIGLRAVPDVQERMPYIWGRALDPGEIESHFFGRSDEQRQILDSVTNGQQRLRYVEGIRRAGKSSLLNSVIFEIEKRELPLIPVYISAASVGSLDQAGKILHFLLHMIAITPSVAAAGVTAPSEEACCSNDTLAFIDLGNQLATKLPNQRVVVLLDDFQTLVSAAGASRDRNPKLFEGIRGLLNLIRSQATPSARLLWVFAGQDAFRKYREHLPGALVWGDGRPLPVDFLNSSAVGHILERPLTAMSIKVLPETIERAHALTGGHPEVVQQMGELMWLSVTKERRLAMTPADADEAAQEIAATSDGFADTWYPHGELKRDQRAFVASLINATPVGGSVEPFRLLQNNELTDAAKAAIDDLVARKILVYRSDETIAVRAHVLDLWLHRYIKSSITEGINGSVAIFIDVANLTEGKGSAVVKDLRTNLSDEGISGRFRLATVIDKIETFARTKSPAPVAARWVANYPPRSPAIIECQDKGYSVENIPEKLAQKGSDDVKLREKMWDVEQGYPNVNHFLLVTGDVDYSLAIDKLLRDGKFVHIIARDGGMSSRYEYLAAEYPERFTALTLEELLEG